MRKYSLFSIMLIAFIFCSCRSERNKIYADQLKEEKQKIDDYINRNDIQIATVFPDDDKWEENLYVKTTNGIYFHLVEPGKGDTIQINDLINLRYIKHTLDEIPDTLVDMTSSVKYPYPYTFRFGIDNVPTSWSEAVSYMKRSGSEAIFISPSKTGTNAELNSATPMVYRFKITFQK